MHIEGLKISKLKRIGVNDGDVLHAIKKTDDSFNGFGEAYFSLIKLNKIKGWKKHKKMFMNFIVPHGKVKFVIFDDRTDSLTKNQFFSIVISRENFFRLSIPPGLWVAFQGLEFEESIILNISNIEHDPQEVEKQGIEKIEYDWS